MECDRQPAVCTHDFRADPRSVSRGNRRALWSAIKVEANKSNSMVRHLKQKKATCTMSSRRSQPKVVSLFGRNCDGWQNEMDNAFSRTFKIANKLRSCWVSIPKINAISQTMREQHWFNSRQSKRQRTNNEGRNPNRTNSSGEQAKGLQRRRKERKAKTNKEKLKCDTKRTTIEQREEGQSTSIATQVKPGKPANKWSQTHSKNPTRGYRMWRHPEIHQQSIEIQTHSPNRTNDWSKSKNKIDSFGY